MIIAYFALLAILVSFICGGKLRYMAENMLRCIWLPPLAFAIEWVYPNLREFIPFPISQWQWMAVTLEYALLFLFCFLNWKHKSVRLMLLGSFLNFFVIAWYGFRMPVAPIIHEFPEMAHIVERLRDDKDLFDYVLVEKGAPFLFLGDALIVPFIHTGLASIGDVFLAIGISWLIFEWMRPLNKKKKRPAVHVGPY